MPETIKITIEVPKNIIFDVDKNNLDALSDARKYLYRLIEEEVINKVVEHIIIPDIKVTPEEIKDRMLTILIEKALMHYEKGEI